jgi:HD-like signal output (HDOD) protein
VDPLLAVPAARPVQTVEATTPDVAALVADLHQLPAQRPALLRLIQIADDPDCSASRLGDVAAMDPAFAARLLQLANSAYYGLSGRVTAIGPAVAVLGAETVRGLAVTMALGLAGEHGPLPTGFWERAATTAAGSRLLAPRVGADTGDAFCVGLLREVGQALLFRAAPQSYGWLLELDETALAQAEHEWWGTTNGELAAVALRSTGLPETLCDAISSHQRDDTAARSTALARALRAGVVLSRAVASGEVGQTTVQDLVQVVGGQLEVAAVRDLALRTAAQAAALSASMR